jgi:GNAT superfamily N-acetyltransferase
MDYLERLPRLEQPDMPFKLIPFDPAKQQHHGAAAAIWSAACGDYFAIQPAFVAYTTHPSQGLDQAGWLATYQGQAAGFALASSDQSLTGGTGWVDALAVVPDRQRQGIGTNLLEQAERWLLLKGRQRVSLGGGLRPFTPGLPAALPTEAFFQLRGYHRSEGRSVTWDLAHDLAQYTSPDIRVESGLQPAVKPAGDPQEVLAYLEREFPGRWLFEARAYFQDGGRASDYLLLKIGAETAGFCHITVENLHHPMDRFYPHRLPCPWGQAGPLGVSASRRGIGLGLLLVDQALLHLKSNCVRGCVIDWTTLLDFYARFGFTPYTEYVFLGKNLKP